MASIRNIKKSNLYLTVDYSDFSHEEYLVRSERVPNLGYYLNTWERNSIFPFSSDDGYLLGLRIQDQHQ